MVGGGSGLCGWGPGEGLAALPRRAAACVGGEMQPAAAAARSEANEGPVFLTTPPIFFPPPPSSFAPQAKTMRAKVRATRATGRDGGAVRARPAGDRAPDVSAGRAANGRGGRLPPALRPLLPASIPSGALRAMLRPHSAIGEGRGKRGLGIAASTTARPIAFDSFWLTRPPPPSSLPPPSPVAQEAYAPVEAEAPAAALEVSPAAQRRGAETPMRACRP